MKGDFYNARKTWYEIRRVDPLFPRVDIKIRELEKELRPKQEAKYMSRSWVSTAVFIVFLFMISIPLAFGIRAALPSYPVTPFLTKISYAPTSVTLAPTFVPTLAIGSTMISEKDGMNLVYIPAGEFSMGSNNGDLDEKPIHTVYLDAFWIDRTEVTNEQYIKCISSGVCTQPSSISSSMYPNYYGNPEFDNYPVIHVDWNQANHYCAWAGRRLPTESEWEKAARGTDGRTYPWGEEISCSQANYRDCIGDTNAVGSYASGVSPYGAYDMAGNVWEWVQDWYSAEYYVVSPNKNPLGPESGTYHVVRGGAWDFTPEYVTVSDRFWGTPDSASNDFGFRCAKDATP